MGKQSNPQQNTSSVRFPWWGLAGILLIFIAFSTLFSVVVPITQGEDELAHYRYISFIAENGRLPANSAERQQAWYRSDWPPLYHLIVGAIVSPLDTAQPHLKDVGESPRRRLVGEIFYPRLIILTEDVNWPWQDGILAWHVGRFISIAFAAGALIFVYLTALELVQEAKTRGGEDAQTASSPPRLLASSPHLFATFTTALIAFTPRFLFTSAMLSDDSLFILLSAIFIWLLLDALRGSDNWWMYAIMGLLLGLSIVTKYSTGLFPLVFIPLIWWRAKQTGWGWVQSLGRLTVAWLFTLLGASWWFGWIIYHFNTVKENGLMTGLLSPVLATGPDVSMRRVFSIFGGSNFTGPIRPDAVAEGTFAQWWAYLFQTFWGVPILETDPFSPWAYLLILAFILISLYGLWRVFRIFNTQTRVAISLLAFIILLLFPFPILRFFLTFNILETGQGRHILYPAAQSFAILLALGWWQVIRGQGSGVRNQGAKEQVAGSKSSEFRVQSSELETAQHSSKTKNAHPTSHIPHPASQSPHYVLRFTFYIPIIFLLLWSSTLLYTMSTAYPDPLPVQTSTFNPTSIPQPIPHNFTDEIQFLGYDFQPNADDSTVNLTLFWKALGQVDENYRTQIQLVDPQGRPHLTWISHPLNGLYPTRAWDKGDVIRDELSLPLAGLPADTYTLEIDLLHEAENSPITEEPFWIIQIPVGETQPLVGAIPFNNRLSYRLWLDDSQVRHRQTIPLSWVNTNPKSKIQNPKWILTGPDNQPYAPVATGDSTAIFVVGSNWPSGEYRLSVAGGESTITPVLTVANNERNFDLPANITSQPGWTPVEASFADKIKLLGYALPTWQVESGGGLPLSLLWQSTAPVQPDAITFAVLLDENQQPHGSVDRYPNGFYSPMLWAEGEVIPDSFALPVSADAPPGVYKIHLGQYQLLEDGIQSQSLPLYHQGQPTENTAVVIGPIKVGGPPSDVVTQNPAPQIEINQSFGDQITLLGYDFTLNSEPGTQNSELVLTLYWQADSPPAADYTTFVHLRDASNQTVAQKDSPPAEGRYPTSLWSPGEIIIDEITLPLGNVPPGEYTPVVGLYNFTTGERLLTPGNLANETTLNQLTISN